MILLLITLVILLGLLGWIIREDCKHKKKTFFTQVCISCCIAAVLTWILMGSCDYYLTHNEPEVQKITRINDDSYYELRGKRDVLVHVEGELELKNLSSTFCNLQYNKIIFDVKPGEDCYIKKIDKSWLFGYYYEIHLHELTEK